MKILGVDVAQYSGFELYPSGFQTFSLLPVSRRQGTSSLVLSVVFSSLVLSVVFPLLVLSVVSSSLVSSVVLGVQTVIIRFTPSVSVPHNDFIRCDE